MSKAPTGSANTEADPFKTLQSILGTSLISFAPQDSDRTELPEDFKAGDLEKPQETQDKFEAYDYNSSLKHFKELHEEIVSASETLDQYHQSLTEFQSNIKHLSTDMEALQTRSLNLSKNLNKYQCVEKRLAPLVEALVIPPSIMKQIVEGDINARWRASLSYIVRRKKEIGMLKDEQAFSAIKSSEYQIQLITTKACEKIRDFIVSRIRRLRMAMVNSQAVQQNLLENKLLYKFLFENNPKLAVELRQAYVYTMTWYYRSYFGRYIKYLEQLPVSTADRSVLLGSDDTGTRRLFGSSSTRSVGAGGPQDYMVLGTRANTVNSEDSSVLGVSNQPNSVKCWMETCYRSLNLALLDNSSVEYHFLSSFFGPAGDITQTFNQIFAPTYELGNAYLSTVTAETYDAYGLLICIRIAKNIEAEVEHRKIPIMQDYLNEQFLVLWPKLQSVIDMHCESLRKASTRSSTFALTSQHAATLVPHQITQHYASFLSGILTLCEGYDSETEPVSKSLLRLRNDFEMFLTKTSAVLNSGSSADKQETFLYNNYFLVYTILSDAEGHLAEQEKEHFKLLTEAYEKKA